MWGNIQSTVIFQPYRSKKLTDNILYTSSPSNLCKTSKENSLFFVSELKINELIPLKVANKNNEKHDDVVNCTL